MVKTLKSTELLCKTVWTEDFRVKEERVEERKRGGRLENMTLLKAI